MVQPMVGAGSIDAESTGGRLRAIALERRRGHRSPREPGAALGAGLAPLSFSQERLWLQYQLDPASSAYNCPFVSRISGRLRIAALEAALNEVMRRHGVLRATFSAQGGEPVQRTEPCSWRSLPVVDVAAMSAGDESAMVIAREASALPFDLVQGPVFRALLLRENAERHLLLLCFHHLVVDGPSIEILLGEVAGLYDSFERGAPSRLPDRELEYSDYAAWQRERAESQEFAAGLSYWTSQLSSLPELRLSERSHPRAGARRGACLGAQLPPALAAPLRALAIRAKASPFMVTLAAFQVLLHRFTGQDDLAVAVPVANRYEAGVHGMIGFFVDTAIVRSSVTAHSTFLDVLEGVRARVLEAFAHESPPFELLVDELRRTNPDASRGPVPVAFAYQHATGGLQQFAGIALEPVSLPTDTVKVDLTLSIVERVRGELSARWEYDRDVFTAELVASLARCFDEVLEFAATEPGGRILTWPLPGVAGADSESDTLADSPDGSAGLATVFEHRVAERPDAIATITPTGEGPDAPTLHVTYAALNAGANRLASQLRGHGVSAESIVGVYAERSIETIAGMLAVLKAGGAFLALEPGHPAERAAFMLEDARVRHLLIAPGLEAPPSELDITCIRLTPSWLVTSALEGVVNPPQLTQPAGAAYVVYTSGSTGRPKGVLATHRGTLNRFEWMWRKFPFGRGELCVQRTSLTFVDSIWEIFGPLLGGACSFIMPQSHAMRPGLMLRALEEQCATRIVLVPTVLNALLDEARAIPLLPSLTLWISSGEVLGPECCRRFHERASAAATLLNLYGSSEVAADVTCYAVRRDVSSDVLPIGTIIDRMGMVVLDPKRRPLPNGGLGSLCVRGPGLARGYLGQPALTAERFIPDPSARGVRLGERLYRTGDRGRILADGSVRLAGREDRQVKIHGCRVEPAEIELALARCAGVARAAIVNLGAARAKLVAYWVPDEELEVGGAVRASMAADARLRRELRATLPEYMIPAEFVCVSTLPLTPSGKIDRARLQREAEAREVSPEPPRPDELAVTPLEKTVLDIIAAWVGEEPLSPESRILSVATNSIVLVRLHLALTRSFPGRLSVQELFDNPTVRELCKRLEGEGLVVGADDGPEIVEI